MMQRWSGWKSGALDLAIAILALQVVYTGSDRAVSVVSGLVCLFSLFRSRLLNRLGVRQPRGEWWARHVRGVKGRLVAALVAVFVLVIAVRVTHLAHLDLSSRQDLLLLGVVYAVVAVMDVVQWPRAPQPS